MEGKIKQNSSIELAHHLGKVIKELRLNNHLTIAEVAEKANISRGMLSKIENAQTATSLDTLVQIANALGVSVASLFQGYDNFGSNAQHVKSGKGMEVVRRGTKCGHTYHLLAYDHGPTKVFEPFFLTIEKDFEGEYPLFQHPGTEFIYVLSGEMIYRHGEHSYHLEPGDALTFAGDVPHGPEKLISFPINFLSIFIYPPDS